MLLVLAGCPAVDPGDEPFAPVDSAPGDTGNSTADPTTDPTTDPETATAAVPGDDSSGDADDDASTGEPPPDSAGDDPQPTDPPPGGDTQEPFPIDMGDAPDTPGTYKGLPLRLVDNGSPQVDPVDGVIGVVCIGMSNATQECSAYISQLGDELTGHSAQIRVIDCAVGGHAIEKWADPAFDSSLWARCHDRVAMAGLTPQQVRVLYHKAANQFTAQPDMMTPLPPYPRPRQRLLQFHRQPRGARRPGPRAIPLGPGRIHHQP